MSREIKIYLFCGQLTHSPTPPLPPFSLENLRNFSQLMLDFLKLGANRHACHYSLVQYTTQLDWGLV